MNARAGNSIVTPAHLHEKVFFARQTAVLVVAVLCILLRERLLGLTPVLIALGLISILNITLYALNRRGRFSSRLETAQITLEAGAVSVMVWSSGGIESPFFVLYLAEILAGAISLSRRGTLTAIAASVAGYLVAAAAWSTSPATSPVFWFQLITLPAAGCLTLRLISRMRQTLQFRAAATAHEIRNSVHVVCDVLHEVAETLPDGEAEWSLVERARAELDALSGFCQRLYDDTRGPMRKAVPFRTVICDALILAGPALRAAAVRPVLRMPPGPLWLRADPDALRHCLLNLLLNAAHHAERGTDLVIQCCARWGEIRIDIAGQPGAPSATALSPSVSARESWGMGLRVTRDSVGREGGRLEVSSSPDAGPFRTLLVLPALVGPWSHWGVWKALRGSARRVSSPEREVEHSPRA